MFREIVRGLPVLAVVPDRLASTGSLRKMEKLDLRVFFTGNSQRTGSRGEVRTIFT